ncbi:hypothetical protein ACLOJK_040434 [Asimina triloba]
MAFASARATVAPPTPSSNPHRPSPLLRSSPSISFSICRPRLRPSFLGHALKLPATPNLSTSKPAHLKILAVDSRPKILVSEKLGEAGLQLLREFGDLDCSYSLSREELCSKIALCDALIVRSGTKVTRQVFEAAKGRLKVVGRAGVGIDNVDLQAATEHGCLVVNAPTANTVAAAEHGIALLAAMARNVSQSDASMKAGEALNLLSPLDFSSSLVGVVELRRSVEEKVKKLAPVTADLLI